MGRTVVIDYEPSSAAKYRGTHAVIAVDVIRASTTATTAVHLGREVYLSWDADDAFTLARGLEDPLLVGEMGGNVPYGFHMTNSPVHMAALNHLSAIPFAHEVRPIILVSSSGTKLMLTAAECAAVYVGCARNYSAVAALAASRHERIAVIGAGTRGSFRREDQIVCSWIAGKLVEAGHTAEDAQTTDWIARWQDVGLEAAREGRSADYLRKTGQVMDLEFIVHHIDDVATVPMLVERKLTPLTGPLERGALVTSNEDRRS